MNRIDYISALNTLSLILLKRISLHGQASQPSGSIKMQKYCFSSGAAEKLTFCPDSSFRHWWHSGSCLPWPLPPCAGGQGWVPDQVSRHWLQCPPLFFQSLIINHSVPWRRARLPSSLFSHPTPLASGPSSSTSISVKISLWGARSVKCLIGNGWSVWRVWCHHQRR